MVYPKRGHICSRKCEMFVFYGEFAKGRPRQPIRSNVRYFGEVWMFNRRRFEDSSESRREPCVVGQEESQSRDNNNTGLNADELEEILEELRIE